MSHFLYFLADRTSKPSAEELAALGLAYAFDAAVECREAHRGPDGHAGVVLSASDRGLGFFPDRQTWRRMDRGTEGQRDGENPPVSPSLSPSIYLGYSPAALPTPDELARPEPISGHWLKLDDGHHWLAPCARRWEEFEDRLLWDYNFPRRLSYQAGRWAPGEVKPRYARLWELAVAYETAAQAALDEAPEEASGVSFRFDEIDELAIGALQINYRVGPHELDVLGIYDVAARQQIIRALLDTPTWEQWLKKKLAAAARGGASSSSGPAPPSTAAAPVTPPLVPTSPPSPPVCTAPSP